MLTNNDETSVQGNECIEEISSNGREFISICLDYKTKSFFAFLAIYLLIATAFNINGSSIGMFDSYFNVKTESHTLFGTPKEVRMDEWLIHTPAIISQYNSTPPFPTENYSLGGYKTPLIMNVPVVHFSTILRPQYWLFFIIGLERAYAFYWNFKLVILMSGVFVLLMLLLDNNFLLSLFGAMWVFFSGYLQWWYSSPQMWPELVGFFGLFTSAALISLVSKRKTYIVLASLLFLVAFFNFAVTLYPPHQIPLVYLSACIILGVLFPRHRLVLSEIINNKFRLVCISATLLLTAGLLYLWFNDTRQTLEALANTVYPGQRRVAGGGMSIAKIFDGFYGIFLADNNYPLFPNDVNNACEASNFLLLFPIPMMLMLWRLVKNKRVSAIEIAFAIYIMVVLVWQIWGFPQPVAQFTLFDRVTEKRTLLSLGIASIFWTCFSLHHMIQEKSNITWRFRVIATIIITALTLYYSLYFNYVTDNFAFPYQITFICLFVAVAVLLFLSRQPKFFAALILIPNIYFYGLVNPVCIGLQPILGNPIYKDLYQFTRQEHNSKWIVFGIGDQLIANLAHASGAHVFNGSKYVPHIEDMKKLSTKASDMAIYNRYGYIVLLPSKDSEISFNLSSDEGVFIISANLNNDCWKRLGITNVLLSSEKGISLMNLYP